MRRAAWRINANKRFKVCAVKRRLARGRQQEFGQHPDATHRRGDVRGPRAPSRRWSRRTIRPDVAISEVVVAEHDALILPGGVINPDALRGDAAAVALIRAFVAAGKPVGAICHGPWLLVEADVVRGRRVTGWRSILSDLRNAGGILVDEAAVTDGMIVTSRSPRDVAAFTAAMIDLVVAAKSGAA